MVKIFTVPNDIADKVERWVTSTKVPWFYFNHTLGENQMGSAKVDQNVYTLKDLPRFTHYFFPNSRTPQEDKANIGPLTEWVIKDILPGYEVKRVMGNLTTQIPNAEMYLNIPHVDMSSQGEDKMTFLYYVNTSDGKTVFFKDGKIDCEVQPIKGTGALFPCQTVHAGQVPSINRNRFVINIIFSKIKRD